MPLSRAERKDRMPHGAQRKVAEKQKVADSYITAVMNGTVSPKSTSAKRKLSRVQSALARELGLPREEVFPETEQETAPPVASVS